MLLPPVESDQYTSWAFGHRLREAGLLGSMGSIGDCFDNSVAESFFATLQTELLDRSTWPTREGLAQAVFAFIEGFYNPRRRHSTLGYLSPATTSSSTRLDATPRPPHDACHHTRTVRADGATSVSFYERHGFSVVGESTAGDCPPVVSMLRPAW